MREPAFPLFHPSPPQLRLPAAFFRAVRRSGTRLTEHVLWVVASRQQQFHFRRTHRTNNPHSALTLVRKLVVSTSRFGIGQTENSNQTPLGLHAIAEKIGAGWPAGTVFKGRRPVGYTWKGMPDAKISSRILWLQGLEPGFNRGGSVDSHARYIYIHGVGDETTLGRPASCGCIHVAARDLMPLFDELPVSTLVWISR